MEMSLQRGSLKIATVFGIPIRVHFSWLIIFGLITWSLSTSYFPVAAPRLPQASYWMSGATAALLLFVSVALHELSHSFVARKYRIPIEDITLFIFGGVARINGEPATPKAEFRMAIAGPLCSLILALAFFITEQAIHSQVVQAIFSYLATLNLMLGIFNLIPGYPMDGGRVVRAYLWQKSGNLLTATQRASRYGERIALLFIFLGLISLFTGFPGGLWFMLIGWFLFSAAQASLNQASLQDSLGGIHVGDIMARDIVALSPEVTIKEAVNDYFLRYGYGGFPVLDKGEFLGFVTLREAKDRPRENWAATTVSEVLVPHERSWEVGRKDSAMKALEMMIREDQGRLPVMEQGRLVGIITRNGIARYVQIKGQIKEEQNV
ncbi:MAG: site-2 protease family protein [Thermodesulfovibrionales bacterium]|jgi:Zn-dependent protease/CBS domain-containing protein